jgi:hypothetical protein
MKQYAQKNNIIILVESTDKGRDAWWYVKCPNRIMAEKLKGICRLGTLDIIPLDEYGEIILSGWGKNPPPEAVKQIEEY